MAKIVLRWSMKKLVWMIVQILNNKFDCFLVIEGNRGLGKSTLAIHLTRQVSREFKNLDQKIINSIGEIVYYIQKKKQKIIYINGGQQGLQMK